LAITCSMTGDRAFRAADFLLIGRRAIAEAPLPPKSSKQTFGD
jgi:hypothetical protein